MPRFLSPLLPLLLLLAPPSIVIITTDAFLPPLLPSLSHTHTRITTTISPPPLTRLQATPTPTPTTTTSVPLKTLDELAGASITLPFGRADFPPTPDTLFPASVDYLLTLSVDIAGKPFTFTLDTTASVNLVTNEVKEAVEEATAAASAAAKRGFGGFGGGGGGGKKQSKNKNKKGKKKGGKQRDNDEDDDEEGGNEDGMPEDITLDINLPSNPPTHIYTRALVSDAWGGVGAGCLGLPFLRSFSSLEINLKTMDGKVGSPKPTTEVEKVGSIEEFTEKQQREEGKEEGKGEWTVDFAPLSIKMGMGMEELSPEDLSLDEEGGVESDDDEEEEKNGGPTREMAEVWIVDVHLDGSEAGIPAIVDLGCQSSILNWKAARALGYKRAGKDTQAQTQTDTQKDGDVGEDDGKTRIVTPQLAGEVEGQAQGEQGIEVCFAEETQMSLGAGKIELPSRRLAIADLPVFAYAGLKKTPAMVLGLDVLGSAGDRLVLDWAERRLTLQGPLFPIKQGKASLELPLLMFDSREEKEKDTQTYAQPPFGLLRQYAVPAVLGEDQEAVLMLDTAAGATVLKSEVWEEYKIRFSARQAQQQQQPGTQKEEILEETIDMTGPGGSLSTKNKAKKVLLGMHIGGTESREGHAIVTHAAVLPVWRSAPKFDGVLGQSFLAEYPLVDFDFRHEMVRMYEREEGEGEKGEKGEKGSVSSSSVEGRLDYWPVPGSSTTETAAKLIVGVATDLVGPNHFLAVHVYLNTHTHTPILGLLDTGAQTSVLNWQAAKALGLAEESKEILSSTATAVGIDGKPTKLKYASFSQVAFEGKDGKDQHLIIPPPEGHTQTKTHTHTHTNIAIADMPGLAGLGLLEVPAMIVGLDLLDGGRRGRLVIDAEGERLFLV